MKIPLRLFLIGASVHVFYLIVIFIAGSKFVSLFGPDQGQLTGIAGGIVTDSPSYISSADNFIEYGIFGHGTVADYHRTVGYPALLALFKCIFGQWWYVALVVFQCFAAAVIYPFTFLIGKMITPTKERTLFWATMVMLFSGVFMTRTWLVMSDLTCAVFFFPGLYFTLRAVVKNGDNRFFITGVLLLSVAASIRPALSVLAIALLPLMLYLHSRNDLPRARYTLLKIFVSAGVLLVTCNLSSIRLWYYHGEFTSTDVLSVNKMYTVKDVLEHEHAEALFRNDRTAIDYETDWRRQGEMRNDLFMRTVKLYPASCVRYWMENALSHLASPHAMETGSAFGYYKRDIEGGGVMLREASVMKWVYYTFSALQIFLILIPFCAYVWIRCRQERDSWFGLSMLVFVVLLVGPSFLAVAGPRMRMPVEPFFFMCAFAFLEVHVTRWVKRVRVSRNA